MFFMNKKMNVIGHIVLNHFEVYNKFEIVYGRHPIGCRIERKCWYE